MGSGRAARQSGVIPYRILAGEVEVLLITSSGGSHWIVPKGSIEPRLTPAASAVKEAYEEAGVVGVVDPRVIGSFDYVKRGVTRVVDLFPMAVAHVLDAWPEMAERRRQWVTVEQAAFLLNHPRLYRCLFDLCRWLADDGDAEAAA